MEKNPTRNESSGASDVRGNPCSIRSINTTVMMPYARKPAATTTRTGVSMRKSPYALM